MHTYIHTSTHTYKQSYIYICIHTYIHIQPCMHTYILTYIHTYIHSPHICLYAYIHTCLHMQTHIEISHVHYRQNYIYIHKECLKHSWNIVSKQDGSCIVIFGTQKKTTAGARSRKLSFDQITEIGWVQKAVAFCYLLSFELHLEFGGKGRNSRKAFEA